MRVIGGTLVAVVGAFAFTTAPALAANQTVNAFGVQFLPSTVEIFQGESVTWTNGGGTHDVTFDDGTFQQPSLPSPDAWTVTRVFDAPGAFRYYCSIHGGPDGIAMSGTVVVNQTAPPSSGSGSAGGTSGPGSTQPASQQAVPVTCVSKRRFRIRLREPRGARIRSARVSVNGRSVAVTKRVIGGRVRHTAEVDLRGLGKGAYRVDIVATTDKGKRLRGTRTYQTCAGKLESSGLPQL